MKTRNRNLLPLFAALLLLSACAAGKSAPRRAPVPESRTGEYLVRSAAAELHIVSPGGRISIGKLEIDNGKTPLVAQVDSPAPAQRPFPAAPAAPAPAAGREAGPAPAADSGGDVGGKPVTEQVERTDAAAGEYREPETRKGRLPGKLPE